MALLGHCVIKSVQTILMGITAVSNANVRTPPFVPTWMDFVPANLDGMVSSVSCNVKMDIMVKIVVMSVCV